MLRLAELAARKCDGKDASAVSVLIAAIFQCRSKSKCRKLEAPLAPVTDYGWITGKPS